MNEVAPRASLQSGVPTAASESGALSLGRDDAPSVEARPLFWIAFFVAIAIVLIGANWHAIRTQNVEIGDFAANSLLIQDAKSLRLLKGNYSRIGVNHPGPAILYVLAFGEWAFHDVVPLGASPFSGQLIGVALYTAFWLTFIGRMLLRLTPRLETALFGVAVFLLVTALCDHDFLAGAWFPNLYYFPFAAFLLAAARLAEGRGDALWLLATSAGFLVDGHVSFVPIVAIVVVTVVVINYAFFRRGPLPRRIVGTAFFAAHRSRVGWATLVFVVFLVPLLVDTILHFPGPVAGYVGFGSAREPQSLEDALRFVAVYWGGVVPLLGALATAALLLRPAGGGTLPLPERRGLIGAFAAATIAVLVYARYGIDELQYVYLALFYYAVPALMIGLTAMSAADASSASWRRPVMAIVAIGCLGGVITQAVKPARYAEQYDDPNVVGLQSALKEAATGTRIVLDLDNRQYWDYLWTHLVGAENLGKRHGDDSFCINRNWHILFTSAARCTAAELRDSPRFIVRARKPEEVDAEPAAFTAGGLRFYASSAPDLSDVGTVPVASNVALFADHVLASGWDVVEGDHAWSILREAHLSLRLGANFKGTVALDLEAFLPQPDGRQRVVVDVDGGEPRTFDFTHEMPHRTVEMPVATGDRAATLDVRLRIGPSLSPRQAGIAPDARVLGVSLRGLSVARRDPAAGPAADATTKR